MRADDLILIAQGWPGCGLDNPYYTAAVAIYADLITPGREGPDTFEMVAAALRMTTPELEDMFHLWESIIQKVVANRAKEIVV